MTKWLGMLMLLSVLVSAGCASKTADNSTPPEANSSVPECASSPASMKREPGQFDVFFTCTGDPLPATPRALHRVAPAEEAGLKAALEELLKGPTPEEEAMGFRSDFSRATAGMLRNLTVTDDGLAIVDFADFRDRMNNAGTTAGTGQLLRELGYTVFQFDEVQAVEYRLEASCDAFFAWLQSSCRIVPASEYRSMEQALEQAPEFRDWKPPADGSRVPWNTLPSEAREAFAKNGVRSVDGKWVAVKVKPWIGLPQLWLAATNATTARLIESDMGMYGLGEWGPDGTFYYRRDDDSWRAVDPDSGAVQPFLPDVLKGRGAGRFRFSPDGKRMLFTTGLCYCNRPPQGPLTTYVVDLDGNNQEQIGVDVEVRWEGDVYVVTPHGL